MDDNDDVDNTFDEREDEMYDEADGPKRWVRRPVPGEWMNQVHLDGSLQAIPTRGSGANS